MATRDANERRLRLGVWAGFQLPDLGLAADEATESRLQAAFFDTADLLLLRRGVTVRADEAGWTVRRGGEPDAALAAVGATGAAAAGNGASGAVAGEPAAVPEAITDVTVAWRLGEPLVPVARLATVRRAVALRDGRRELARLTDDEVSLLRGERVAARFRELELVLVDGARPRTLHALGQRLRAAGAQPIDPVSKLVRGLGPEALEPPPPFAADGTGAAEAVRARLARSLAAWVEHHAPLLLAGAPADVRAVRSAVRGLRRDLRLLAPLVDARAGLGWLVDALTAVRRLDRVLERTLDEPSGADLAAPGDRVAAEPSAADLAALREQVAADRAHALAAALDCLRTARYAALLRDVARVVDRPPPAFKPDRSAAEVLPRLVRDPLRRLRRASAEDPERLRKLVERVVTAVDVAAPHTGADAERAASALAALHDALREHHRARTTLEILHALAARSPEHAWAAGLLAGRESVRAAEAQEALPYALQRATRRKLWTWVP